jgi:hypothetical protein
LEIALTYGEHRVVVSRLTTLQQHTDLADVVKKAFEQSR